MAAVRSSGFASLRQVEAVVLETDGSFSVKLGLNAQFLPADGPRVIKSSNTVTLRDGESTKITGADDKGGAFTVDVTLTLVK